MTVGNVHAALQAAVTQRTGDKVELRYVDVPPNSERAMRRQSTEDPSKDGDLIATLQRQFAVSLSDAQRTAIADATSRVQEPRLMIGGGLYLSKLSLPVDAEALDALYVAQVWQQSEGAAPSRSAPRMSIDLAGASAMTSLATKLRGAVNPHRDGTSSNVVEDPSLTTAEPAPGLPLMTQDSAPRDSHGGERHDDLARQLLNEQDGGSVAYHYGTLPLLIADQLVELDLVYFRERVRTEHSSNRRRLVMTFRTESLGRVQIVAQALAEHLAVEISSESTESNAALMAHAQDVGDLLSRLGWNVDAVRYELRSEAPRAAGQVIAHVLNAETLDRLV